MRKFLEGFFIVVVCLPIGFVFLAGCIAFMEIWAEYILDTFEGIGYVSYMALSLAPLGLLLAVVAGVMKALDSDDH